MAPADHEPSLVCEDTTVASVHSDGLESAKGYTVLTKEGISEAYFRKILTKSGSRVKWEVHADLDSNPIPSEPGHQSVQGTPPSLSFLLCTLGLGSAASQLGLNDLT